MKHRGRIVVLLAFAAFLWGCDNAVSPVLLLPNDPEAIKGKRWEWVGYTSFKKGYSDDIPDHPYFTIDSLGAVVGSTACNSFQGQCILSPSTIRFNETFGTALHCPSKPNFHGSFTGPAAYKQRDSVLLIIPSSGEYMHLFFRAR